MLSTWSTAPSKRPNFSSITSSLEKIVLEPHVHDYLVPEGCDQHLESSISTAEDMTCKSQINLFILSQSECLGNYYRKSNDGVLHYYSGISVTEVNA